MKKYKELIPPIVIALIGIVMFFPFLGSVHLFDWDEINFAESAREMIVTGDYLTVRINWLPFHEKPPLFLWMQVLSMKMFGINEFAARFPNAVVGIFTLLVLYGIGKKLYNTRFGILWSLAYAGSILPHLYFKSGIIDPWFNLFIFLGIYYLIQYCAPNPSRKQIFYIFLSAIFAGLGILTKGPVALLIIALVALVWVIITKQWKLFINLRFLLLYALIITIVGGSWFIIQIIDGNGDMVLEFIRYQIRLFTQEDAGHGGFLLYHFVILFFGVFPASIFALKAFRKYEDENSFRTLFRNWMMITFGVALILFTIVNTKIVHYSSICYIPLTFLATFVIYRMINKKIEFSRWLKIILVVLSVIYGGLIIVLQLVTRYKDEILARGMIRDDFASANLEAVVHWSGWEFMVGVILIIGTVGSLLIFRKKILYQIIGIFVSCLLYTNLTMTIIVPKVEKYTQNAAIEFYEKISEEDCVVETWGFKSYAQYFYSKSTSPENFCFIDRDCILRTGVSDKPVYIVTKNYRAIDFRIRHPEYIRLYDKNGFVFFKQILD